jgi:putative hydrolase of the HAD superfamily
MAKTIIFDLGGVLLNLDWDKVCAHLTRISGQTYDAVMAEVQNGPIVELSMLGHLTPGEFHQALCAKISADIAFEPFIDIWNGLLSADDDMASLVEDLGSEHTLALASNTDAIHLAFARANFSVMGAFEQSFLSYEMELLKPDPAYFHHVLYGLWASPENCVFIDDRPENVRSAQNAGIIGLVFESIDKLKSDLESVL